MLDAAAAVELELIEIADRCFRLNLKHWHFVQRSLTSRSSCTGLLHVAHHFGDRHLAPHQLLLLGLYALRLLTLLRRLRLDLSGLEYAFNQVFVASFEFFLVLALFILVILEPKSRSALGLSKHHCLVFAFESGARIVGGANVVLVLRVYLLRHGALVLTCALGVVKLDAQLLKLLHLRFEAPAGHFLVEGAQLKVCSLIFLGHLDFVAQPGRDLRFIAAVHVALIQQQNCAIVLHMANYSADRLIYCPRSLLIIPVFAGQRGRATARSALLNALFVQIFLFQNHFWVRHLREGNAHDNHAACRVVRKVQAL